jgi:ABC-type bacteriocin/lantibiotic exporter with double-glycine peptidase domain
MSGVTGFSAGDLLGDKAFDTALDGFHETILQGISAGEEKEQIKDRRHFDQRIIQDFRRLEKTLFHLGATLFRKKITALQPSGKGSSLFASAVAVAQACGIRTEKLSDAVVRKQDDLNLDHIARAGNFFTRRVVLTPGWSGKDNGPLLGRLEDEKGERFVALLPTSPTRYALFDPENGTRIPMTRGLEERIHGIAHTFYRPLPPESLTIRHILRFVLAGVRRDLTMMALVGAAGALLALLIPIMTGVIIDSVIPEANRGELLQIGLILLVSVFAAFMFQITRAIAMVRMEGRMDAGLQAAVLDRLLNLPIPFFRKFTAGDLATRTMGIHHIRQILSGATLTTAMTGIFSSFNLIVMFIYDWHLALIGLGMILITLIISGGLSISMIRY